MLNVFLLKKLWQFYNKNNFNLIPLNSLVLPKYVLRNTIIFFIQLLEKWTLQLIYRQILSKLNRNSNIFFVFVIQISILLLLN